LPPTDQRSKPTDKKKEATAQLRLEELAGENGRIRSQRGNPWLKEQKNSPETTKKQKHRPYNPQKEVSFPKISFNGISTF